MTGVSLVGIGSTYSAPGRGLDAGILPDLMQKAGDSLRGGFRVTGRGWGEKPALRREGRRLALVCVEENSQLSYLLLCGLCQVAEAGCHIHQALLESGH